jgi:RNA recognition motif-containing protein
MAKKLYVGNLSYSTTDQTLNDACAPYGTVTSATVVIDKMSGRSRGFGFVEMSTDAEAQAVIDALNGKDLDGRQVVVNEARPQEKRDNRGGFDRPKRNFSRNRDW